MGWAFVRRRMMAELGPDWQKPLRKLRARSRRPRPRSARCIARARMTGGACAASCNIPTCSPPSRRISTSSICCSRCIGGMDPAIDTTRDRCRRSSARLREELDYELRGEAHRALRSDLRRRSDRIRVPSVLPELSTQPAAHHDLARGRGAARLHRTAPLEERNHIATRHVPRLVVSRSATTA